MPQNKAANVMAVVSTIGILCCIATYYFDGMTPYLILGWPVLIPVVILYIVSLFQTIASVIKKGISECKISAALHTVVLMVVLISVLAESEWLKSKKVLTATLKDDQFLYTLIFRKNGDCENEITSAFFSQEVILGKYKLKGDTIIFAKKPYNNNFIPDTLLIDRKAKAIFITKDKSSKFSTEKKWLNHFIIHD